MHGDGSRGPVRVVEHHNQRRRPPRLQLRYLQPARAPAPVSALKLSFSRQLRCLQLARAPAPILYGVLLFNISTSIWKYKHGGITCNQAFHVAPPRGRVRRGSPRHWHCYDKHTFCLLELRRDQYLFLSFSRQLCREYISPTTTAPTEKMIKVGMHAVRKHSRIHQYPARTPPPASQPLTPAVLAKRKCPRQPPRHQLDSPSTPSQSTRAKTRR